MNYKLKYDGLTTSSIDEIINKIIQENDPVLINCNHCKNTGQEEYRYWRGGSTMMDCPYCKGNGGSLIIDVPEIFKNDVRLVDEKGYTIKPIKKTIKTKNI